MDHIINYFEHHYDFKVISATFKSRPSKFVKHFGNALMAVIAVHSKSSMQLSFGLLLSGIYRYGGKAPRL